MSKLVPENAVLIPSIAKRVFDGQIFDVYQWLQPLFDGSKTTFEMLRRPDTVSIIGIVEDKLLIINDTQPHSGSMIGFPGGRVDESDGSILSAAEREMREETGYEFTNWRLVTVYQPQVKIEWFVYVFIAWDGHQVSEQQLDSGEKIEVLKLSFEEVKQRANDRQGYLGEARQLFEALDSTEQLKQLPEFVGKEVTVVA